MIRRDKNSVAWFNPANGDKLRFAVGKYEKARSPELVDMKITDYCAFGCAFCYQASTLQGKHAEYGNVRQCVRMMQQARVFEVALGGGEPTDHPRFIDILMDFRVADIVPNFTTKSLGWVKRNWTQVESIVGAFAFSCEKAADVASAAKSLANVPRSRVNLHYVMGLEPPEGYVAFMRAAHQYGFRVTLLGYKTVGRGIEVVPHDYSNWILLTKMLVAAGVCPTLSIDTPLAAQYANRLPVPQHAFHTKEGFVSAYIDAVQMGMSASSFENQNLIPLTGDLCADYAQVTPS